MNILLQMINKFSMQHKILLRKGQKEEISSVLFWSSVEKLINLLINVFVLNGTKNSSVTTASNFQNFQNSFALPHNLCRKTSYSNVNCLEEKRNVIQILIFSSVTHNEKEPPPFFFSFSFLVLYFIVKECALCIIYFGDCFVFTI